MEISSAGSSMQRPQISWMPLKTKEIEGESTTNPWPILGINNEKEAKGNWKKNRGQ